MQSNYKISKLIIYSLFFFLLNIIPFQKRFPHKKKKDLLDAFSTVLTDDELD